MKQDSLDKLLRQKLEGMSVPPPPGMWERIEATLSTGEGIPTGKPGSADKAAAPDPGPTPSPAGRPVPLRRKLWSYGTAACLLLGMAALWHLYDIKPGPEAMVAVETPMAPILPGNLAAHSETNVQNLSEAGGSSAAQGDASGNRFAGTGGDASGEGKIRATVRAALARTAPPATVPAPSEAYGGVSGADMDSPSATTVSTDDSATPANGDTGTMPNATVKEPQPTATPQKSQDRAPASTRSASSTQPAWYAEAEREESRKKRNNSTRRISASLFADNLAGSSQNGNQYGGMSAALSDFSIMEGAMAPASGGILLYRGSGQESNMHHRTPVSFGAGVSFSLGKKFALETGLLYTKLHSEMESNGTFRYNIEQNLHYLGVPLSVNYTIAENRRLSFYARAGATAEYCVSGKRTRSVGTDQEVSQRETTDLKVNGLQTSLGAALGGMFKITPSVGIYVEPGVSHYFENSNQPDSYRTEHPTNFNLRAGLRFSFR